MTGACAKDGTEGVQKKTCAGEKEGEGTEKLSQALQRVYMRIEAESLINYLGS